MTAVKLPKRFALIRKLGAGRTGAVYEALDQETGARVAVKMLSLPDENLITRFKRVYRELLREGIRHPNLVTLRPKRRASSCSSRKDTA